MSKERTETKGGFRNVLTGEYSFGVYFVTNQVDIILGAQLEASLRCGHIVWLSKCVGLACENYSTNVSSLPFCLQEGGFVLLDGIHRTGG